MSTAAVAPGLVRHAGVYLVAQVLARLQFFVTLPLVSRQVSPAEYGVLTLANLFAVFVSSAVQSTVSGSVERFYADHSGREREEYLGTIYTYLLALCTGALILAVLLGPPAKAHLVEADSYRFWPYFLVPIVTALIASVNTFSTSLFRIEEKPGRVLAFAAFRFVSALVAVWIGVGVLRQGLVGYLVALLSVEALIAFAALPYTLTRIRPAWNGEQLRNVLGFTLPLVPYVALAFLRDTGDRWILQHYATIESVGVYGLGWGIASGMGMVVSSLSVPYGASMMTRFAGEVSEERERENLRLFRPAATQVAVLTLLAYAVFLLLVRDVVRLLTPTTFHGAWVPATMLGAVYVVRSFFLVPHNALQWMRKTRTIPIATAAGVLAGLPLIVVLAPRIGIAAGAIGVAVAYAVAWAACGAFVPRIRWLFPSEAGPVAIGVAVCVVAAGVAIYPFSSPILWNGARAVFVIAVCAWIWSRFARIQPRRGGAVVNPTEGMEVGPA
jgi:O-antigen/teichoic acid export membrane protein